MKIAFDLKAGAQASTHSEVSALGCDLDATANSYFGKLLSPHTTRPGSLQCIADRTEQMSDQPLVRRLIAKSLEAHKG